MTRLRVINAERRLKRFFVMDAPPIPGFRFKLNISRVQVSEVAG
jgi:hypothetical protein